MDDSDAAGAVPAKPAARTAAEMATSAARPYASAQPRAVWAVAFLLAVAVASVILLLGTIVQIGQLNQVLAGTEVPTRNLERSDLLLQLGAIGYSVAFVASMVAFSMWFHRTYRNLPALGAKNLLTKPGWAVGSFFIPILNLFRPYQAAREIVVYSDPEYAGDRLASSLGAPALLKWWWGAWIIGNVVSRMGDRVTDLAEEAESLIIARVITGMAEIVLLSAGIMAIVIIRRATADQDARNSCMTKADITAP
jgi:hypothetical protein